MSYKSENLFKKLLYASSGFWKTSMSTQLVSYGFCLNSSIDSMSNTLLNMMAFFVLFVCLIEDGIMKQIETDMTQIDEIMKQT